MRRPAVAAAALFLVLAILHTWPLASAPARLSLNDNADAQLNEWIVSWIAHTLPAHPTRLFDGNIFAPEPHTLTYSEPLIVPALMGAPIRWLGGSPVLTFNVLLIAGLTLTALSAWFVAWRWTGSTTAALVAGVLAAFNVHLLTRLPHLQAAHAWGLPLVVYLADQLIDRPNRRDAAWLAVVIAAIAATSIYWLALAAVIVVVIVVIAATGLRLRSAFAIGSATVLGLVLATPVLAPYVRVAATGVTRPLEMVAQMSATPAGYFVSTSRVYTTWSAPLRTSDLNVFFPGIVALVLAGIGMSAAIASGGANRRRMMALLGFAAIGVVLSFGPSTVLYRWLYQWLPPLRGLRAAARFGYLLLLAASFAAAFGLAWIERHWRSRGAAVRLASTAIILATAEVWQGQVRTRPFKGVAPIYSLLADVKTPVRLAEVPFYLPAAVFENGEYVLNSTAHWQPLVNGYSGFTPDSYRRLADTLWLFPAEFAMQTIAREGITHVMVHLERFGAEAPAVARALDGRADLRLIAADKQGHRLYAVFHEDGRD